MTFIDAAARVGGAVADAFEGLGAEIASQIKTRGEAHIPVKSSAIQFLQYRSDGTLTVVFHDGARVALHNFPQLELHRWLSSGSVGAYWNAHIRGRY